MHHIGTGISTISVLCAVWLGLLLAGASWTDARSRRISNKLVLAGALTGLALNTLLPVGDGLFSAAPGGLGFSGALGGGAVGLGLLLPFYLLRIMGAGDVKLMAMVGSFLGPASILGAVLMALLAGGILALAVAFWKGIVRSTLANVRSMLINTLLSALSGPAKPIERLPAAPAATLPYALAIAAGTVGQILLARDGHALFL